MRIIHDDVRNTLRSAKTRAARLVPSVRKPLSLVLARTSIAAMSLAMKVQPKA